LRSSIHTVDGKGTPESQKVACTGRCMACNPAALYCMASLVCMVSRSSICERLSLVRMGRTQDRILRWYSQCSNGTKSPLPSYPERDINSMTHKISGENFVRGARSVKKEVSAARRLFVPTAPSLPRETLLLRIEALDIARAHRRKPWARRYLRSLRVSFHG
jgi:hypothetical protein